MPTILAGFRREANEMAVKARLATKDLGVVSSVIRRKQLRERNDAFATMSFDVAEDQRRLWAKKLRGQEPAFQGAKVLGIYGVLTPHRQ